MVKAPCKHSLGLVFIYNNIIRLGDSETFGLCHSPFNICAVVYGSERG